MPVSQNSGIELWDLLRPPEASHPYCPTFIATFRVSHGRNIAPIDTLICIAITTHWNLRLARFPSFHFIRWLPLGSMYVYLLQFERIVFIGLSEDFCVYKGYWPSNGWVKSPVGPAVFGVRRRYLIRILSPSVSLSIRKVGCNQQRIRAKAKFDWESQGGICEEEHASECKNNRWRQYVRPLCQTTLFGASELWPSCDFGLTLFLSFDVGAAMFGYLKTTADFIRTVIRDPNDSRFDLEAYLKTIDAESS